MATEIIKLICMPIKDTKLCELIHRAINKNKAILHRLHNMK